MGSNTNDRQREIVRSFAQLDNWMDKMEHLIEVGKNYDGLPEHFCTPERTIEGCQSTVWLYCYTGGDLIHFSGDSDTIVTKGIISLFVRIFDGCTAAEILGSELFFHEAIGLTRHLTPGRNNGIASMYQRIRKYAEEHNPEAHGNT